MPANFQVMEILKTFYEFRLPKTERTKNIEKIFDCAIVKETTDRLIVFADSEIAKKIANEYKSEAVNIETIIDYVCKILYISRNVIFTKSRKREIVFGRDIISYILRKKTFISYREIGIILGGKNHATVIAAEKKIKDILQLKIKTREYQIITEILTNL